MSLDLCNRRAGIFGLRFSFGLLALSVLVTGPASAGIIPVFSSSLSHAGSFVYDINFSNNTDRSSGQPTERLDSHGAGIAAFTTIYDIPGMVSATLSPADARIFSLSVQDLGETPNVTLPEDNPALPNVTLTYIGAAPLTLDTSYSGALMITSTLAYRSPLGRFSGQDTRSAGLPVDTPVNNIGFTTIPQAPEPAPMALVGGVLLLAGGSRFWLKRRR